MCSASHVNTKYITDKTLSSIRDKDLHIKVLAGDTKENRTLKVFCFAKEPREDDLIGTGEVDIAETLRKPVPEFDGMVFRY